MSPGRSGACTLALMALAGCATEPIVVRGSHVAQDTHSRPSVRPAIEPPRCVVHIRSLSDSRSDPAFLGTVAGRAVLSPGQGAEWIATKLTTGLERHRVRVTFEPPTGLRWISLAEARLISAWVASLSTSMNGTVVLAVRAEAGADETIYRGADTAMNWASGEGEINRLMDRSFDEMLAKLAVDLRELCDQAQ